tara:strand:+ start:1588 stop:3612 length:2025 start_codon:yes stop_codon:yes gene_type:complete
MASIEELFNAGRAPTAKNSIESSTELYREKKYYYEKVYPSENLPFMDKPFDFVNENPLYGKIDLNGNFVTPRRERMTNIGTDGEVLVFDFVADAFNDLKANVQSLVRASALSSAGAIGKFEAKKGFADLKDLDNLQKEMHYLLFVSQTLSSGTAKQRAKVTNIAEFTNSFLSYVKSVASEAPFTKDGIVDSSNASPVTTGLCVEIDLRQYDDDERKHKFLLDPNFNVYRILARRFGFMVDRNVPWRLVADVRSFKMREYMRLAYERNIINKRQNVIIKTKEDEIRATLPDASNLSEEFFIEMVELVPVQVEIEPGVFVESNMGVSKWFPNPNYKEVDLSMEAAWTKEELQSYLEQANVELDAVAAQVVEETKSLWELKQFYNAKAPEVHNGQALCVGDSFRTCQSRVFKFNKFFETYYKTSYLEEIEEFRKNIYNFYTSYYVQYPTVKKRVLCRSGLEEKYVTKEIKLETISQEKFNKLYNEYFWLKVYFDIRLAESSIKFKPLQYNKHLKKIMDLSTLNSTNSTGNYNLSGVTTKNADHAHLYEVDKNGNGWALEAHHPESTDIIHAHQIISWVVQSAQSDCYPDCEKYFGTSGAPPHIHSLNEDILLAMKYINKIIKKRMKGLDKIYKGTGETREESITQSNQNIYASLMSSQEIAEVLAKLGPFEVFTKMF